MHAWMASLAALYMARFSGTICHKWKHIYQFAGKLGISACNERKWLIQPAR